jgi:hypothetical protein
MTTITLNFVELRSIASLATLAASKDNPIIESVRVWVEGTEVWACATDRYRAGIVSFVPVDPVNASEVVSCVINAKDIVRAFNTFKDPLSRGQVVTLSFAADMEDSRPRTRWMFDSFGSRESGYGVEWNYPPVDKLFKRDGDFTGVPSVSLLPSFVADLCKLFHPGDPVKAKAKDLPWVFNFTEGEGSRREPVYCVREDSTLSGTLEVIIMPRKYDGR